MAPLSVGVNRWTRVGVVRPTPSFVPTCGSLPLHIDSSRLPSIRRRARRFPCRTDGCIARTESLSKILRGVRIMMVSVGRRLWFFSGLSHFRATRMGRRWGAVAGVSVVSLMLAALPASAVTPALDSGVPAGQTLLVPAVGDLATGRVDAALASVLASSSPSSVVASLAAATSTGSHLARSGRGATTLPVNTATALRRTVSCRFR